MKQCLICQAGEDTASLLRVPVTIEGSPLGDFIVCSGCFELLGQEKVTALIRAAALAGAEQIASGMGAEAAGMGSNANDPTGDPAMDSAENAAKQAPRTLQAELPASALADETAFAAWLGRQLAPLLLGQYRQGRGQVTLLTSLTQGDGDYQFRAVLGD
jgi:hypothetical protein